MLNNSKTFFRGVSSKPLRVTVPIAASECSTNFLKENPMRQRIHITLVMTIIALICGITTATIWAQETTNSSGKMSNQQMMDKLNHMSTTEKASMFDKMTSNQKMEAMKMAGHDTSKMSHQARMEMMNKMTEDQKADMFDKMPMDTKMATMRMSMREHKAAK